VTGNKSVIRAEHFSEKMKGGRLCATSGHSMWRLTFGSGEVVSGKREVARLWMNTSSRMAAKLLARRRPPRKPRDREGIPLRVMDMSFANQALSAEYLCANHKNLKPASLRGARKTWTRSRPPLSSNLWVTRLDKLQRPNSDGHIWC